MKVLCGARLFPDASLVRASAQESRSATQVAPLEISDSWAVRPRTCCCCQRHLTTELYSRPLKSSYFEVYTDTKYVWYNSFSFHAATKPFHAKTTQNITLCTVHTQKVRNVYHYCEVLLFPHQNNIYTSHQYICYRKHSFKIRPDSQRKTHRGCKLYTMLARGPFMQTMKMCTVHT